MRPTVTRTSVVIVTPHPGDSSVTTVPHSPPTTAPTTTASTPCPGSDPTLVVSCLNRSLSRYWTTTLGTTVRFSAIARPTRAQVPAACRGGLALHSAFTCPADGNVYVTESFIAGLRAVRPSSDLALRLAATMSHEAGHVVQLVERFPLILHGRGDADSRIVEQQADCLSGVWAHAQGIPVSAFGAAARVVLTYVDSAAERRTHGTVAVRLGQIGRGQRGGTARSCGLTVR